MLTKLDAFKQPDTTALQKWCVKHGHEWSGQVQKMLKAPRPVHKFMDLLTDACEKTSYDPVDQDVSRDYLQAAGSQVLEHFWRCCEAKLIEYMDKWSVDNPELEDAISFEDLGPNHTANVQYCNIGHGMTAMTKGFIASVSLSSNQEARDELHKESK